jgi:hypothetical protein
VGLGALDFGNHDCLRLPILTTYERHSPSDQKPSPFFDQFTQIANMAAVQQAGAM